MIAKSDESIASVVRHDASRRGRELDLQAQPFVQDRKVREAPAGGNFKRLDLQPTPGVPRRIRLRELLNYYDRRFVEFAYRCILRRPMDAGGECYVDRLRRGKSRIDTLIRIRYGHEGQLQNTRVRGLRWRRAVFVAARIPVLGIFVRAGGYVFRWCWLLASLPYQQRKQEAWKHYAISLFTKVEEHINDSQKQMENAIAGLRSDRKTDAVSPPHGSNVDGLDLELIKKRIRRDAARKQAAAFKVLARDAIARLGGESQAGTEASLGIPSLPAADAGDAVSPTELRHRRGLIGLLAAIKARVFGKPSRAVTWQQPVPNESTVHVLRILQEEIGRLEQTVARLDSKLEDVSDQASKQNELQIALANRFRLPEAGNLTEEMLQRRKALEDGHPMEEVVQQLQGLFDLFNKDQRIGQLLKEARKRLSRPSNQMVGREEDHALDAYYVAFEDQFRGSCDSIKQLFQEYLPILRRAVEGEVLDLGCGRGEWLELLREERRPARGIDQNRTMIEQCRQAGLEVTEAEIITYLRDLPSGSLAGVTAFHVLEHLPLPALVAVLDETLRVLKPGGVAIFETPNPANVFVGSCTFWLDPTHRQPLPSNMLRFLIEMRGFGRVEVLNLHPYPGTLRLSGSELAERFSDYFYGPQDYAVIGWKV